MPIISIKIAKGRSVETKRKLVKSVTKAVSESLDLSPDLTSVIIEEFERDNWATGGELHIDKYGNSLEKKN
jgi:4-oxalocrotonate tautomerase